MPVNLFDANFYRAANLDLASLNNIQALSHLQTYGLDEERNFSPLVNLNFYRTSNADIATYNYRQAYEHLQKYGVTEGRRFSSLVDLNFYRIANPDLANFNNEQTLSHLQTYGVNEGRSFSPVVDLNFYRAYNHDLALNNNQALQHLEIYGLKEGRLFSQFFDINYYKSHNPDLLTVGLNNNQILEHFQTYGLNEGRKFSFTFDLNYYKSHYPDLAKLNHQQLLTHFELNGLNEGRVGSANFNVNDYLSHSNLTADLNSKQALEHFLLSRQEKRSAEALPTQQWRQDFGTSSKDTSSNVAVDSAGNVYITGETTGSLAAINAGETDAWVAKYDASGNRLWMQQFGTSTNDTSKSIKVDAAGNVYIAGETTGSLAAINTGETEAWVAKYDTRGNRLWMQQFGSASRDYNVDLAIDNTGSVYIAGATDGALAQPNAGYSDAFLVKYNTNGNQQWLRQFGTYAPDAFDSVAVDSQNHVYVVGNTSTLENDTSEGVQNALLVKYDLYGNQVWLNASPTANYHQLTVDSAGQIYVTGNDVTNNPNRSREITLTKYNSSGNILGTQYFGSPASSMIESTLDITVDSANNVYVLVKQVSTRSGTETYSVVKWNRSGIQKQYATEYQYLIATPQQNERLLAIAVDKAHNLYITGETSVSLGGVGDINAWVAKLS